MSSRRILPPVWLGACLAAALFLHMWRPLAYFATLPGSAFGCVLLLFGLFMTSSAAGAFNTVGTPIVPFERSTTLVREGWYRYTRNPMYLGMTLVLFGGGISLGSVGALLPVPVFVAVMQSQFIVGEEKMLTEIFGHEYRDYQSRVRRWI